MQIRNLIVAMLFLGLPALQAQTADPVYGPLWLYNGSWQLSSAGPAKPDRLDNDCSRSGTFFSCQQTVNGKVSALIVFVPGGAPGHYFTQALTPDGRAMGRGELEIAAGHWTYHSKAEEDGKTTYYRTTNDFTGNDHIHFESAQSNDGTHWTTNKSGDEVRVAAPPRK